MALASSSLIGNPSASSMVGCRTSAKLIVPQRDSTVYQASTEVGTVAESSESFSGISPWLFFMYHSMVASLGE